MLLWKFIIVCYMSLCVTAVSEQWCLERGFDSSNLSCDTCALLEESKSLQKLQKEKNEALASSGGEPIDINVECQTCCQDYKVNPLLRPDESLRGKYRYALLTYNENSLEQYGEIKDFLDRDLDDVLSFKGENRFQAVKSEKGPDIDMNMLMMMGGFSGFGGSAPKLMLFEKQKKWTEEDEDEAGEVINLRGWKREDVKDMLLTLLPNS